VKGKWAITIQVQYISHLITIVRRLIYRYYNTEDPHHAEHTEPKDIALTEIMVYWR
jgi:hypothetical protein